MIIEAGYYFGDIDFVFTNNNLRRKFTVKSIENCDLLTLSKQDLVKLDAEYEELVAEIFTYAHKRLRKTLKIKSESESYFLKQLVKKENSNEHH